MELNADNLKIRNKIQFIILAIIFVTGTSCASVTTARVGIQLLLKEFDGDALIKNEENVKKTLNVILLTPENYTITGYTRQVFSPEVKRTPTLYHSFYAITANDMSFFTLGFFGTKKRIVSEGAWAINTESDRKSYINYRYGINEWEVQEIVTDKGINTAKTIKNIISKIDSNIKYYCNDHKNDRKGLENCTTALRNTLVEND